MNQFQYLFCVRVCKKCVPPEAAVELHHNVNRSVFPCERCGESADGDIAVLYYTAEEVLQMTSDLWHNSREINELKTKIKILEKKAEILENHIRFQPNGEGAIEALEHWLSLANPDTE